MIILHCSGAYFEVCVCVCEVQELTPQTENHWNNLRLTFHHSLSLIIVCVCACVCVCVCVLQTGSVRCSCQRTSAV